jgi:hypothetical protein
LRIITRNSLRVSRCGNARGGPLNQDQRISSKGRFVIRIAANSGRSGGAGRARRAGDCRSGAGRARRAGARRDGARRSSRAATRRRRTRRARRADRSLPADGSFARHDQRSGNVLNREYRDLRGDVCHFPIDIRGNDPNGIRY